MSNEDSGFNTVLCEQCGTTLVYVKSKSPICIQCIIDAPPSEGLLFKITKKLSKLFRRKSRASRED